MADLLKPALMYLDSRGIFDELKKCCLERKCDRIWHFVVTVDPADILECDALGSLLLNSPMDVTKIFQEVISTAVVALGWLPSESANQVVVGCQITSSPSLTGYRINSRRDLLIAAKSQRLVQYDAIVYSMSSVEQYTKSARFSCADSTCPGSQGDKFVRLHVPGIKEIQTVGLTFKCPYCQLQLVEDIACRQLGDKVILSLLDSNALSDGGLAVHWTVRVCLRDSLIRTIELGERITVFGIPFLCTDYNLIVIEACGLLCEFESLPSLMVASNEQLIRGMNVSPQLSTLYEACSESPWQFALHLAYHFGGALVPSEAFLLLKLQLLLSLVAAATGKDNERVDLLVCGSDVNLVTRLMYHAASFARRMVVYRSGMCLTAVTSQCQTDVAKEYSTDGGCIPCARGGVCFIPDVRSLKKATQHQLIKVLETGQVTNDSKHMGSGAHQTMGHSTPRRCTVWAVAQLKQQHTERQTGCDLGMCVSVGGDVKEQRDIAVYTSLFGKATYVDVDNGSYIDNVIARHALLTCMDMTNTRAFDDGDIRQLIQVGSQLSVELSSKAEHLIHGYYMASRRLVTVGCTDDIVTARAVSTLTSLATAHARLSLRCTVIEHDAVMAVYLYEQWMAQAYGQSLLNVHPMTHMEDNDVDAYIGLGRDRKLSLFREQLLHFIGTHALTSCSQCSCDSEE